VIYSIIAVLIAMILYEVIDDVVKHMPFNMYWGDSNKNYSVIPKNTKDVCLVSISVLCLVPIAEDIIYRSILVNYLKTKMNIKTTIIMAAVVFSIFHIPFYGIGLSIYMFFWTIISCYLYVKFDNIYPCLIFHEINNLMAYIIFPMVA
ncbi:TPA: lysostaphin resistance A-like protein, partial [Enterococcus faecium]